MASREAIDAAILSLCSEWNKAEKAIKIAEQVNGEIINPAIYELRYGGRRIIEALSCIKTDPVTAKKLLDDAHFDCCRARHDAIDAATSKVSADLKIAIEKLGANNVLTYFPKCTDLSGMLAQVRRKVAISREDRNNRDAVYESIQADNLENIVALYDEFQASEGLLVSAAKRERIVFWSGLIFGAVGALFGIAGVIVALMA